MIAEVNSLLTLVSTVILVLSGCLVWLGRRWQADAERQRIAKRRQQDIEARVQAILEREAESIKAVAQHRRVVVQDARWQHIALWLRDMVRARQPFDSIYRA